MAITIAASFLLIIPIEPVIWLLAIPSGLLIGYYANQRSDRRAGPWSRILRNGVFAALVTGLTTAALLLLLKSIFFFADTGYPDFNRVVERHADPAVLRDGRIVRVRSVSRARARCGARGGRCDGCRVVRLALLEPAVLGRRRHRPGHDRRRSGWGSVVRAVPAEAGRARRRDDHDARLTPAPGRRRLPDTLPASLPRDAPRACGVALARSHASGA